jgi:hypothetical protein
MNKDKYVKTNYHTWLFKVHLTVSRVKRTIYDDDIYIYIYNVYRNSLHG